MSIVYPKDQRANAERQGKDVMVCGVGAAKGGGCIEFVGPVDRNMGQALVYFCMRVKGGMSPVEAFAEIKWPEQVEYKQESE